MNAVLERRHFEVSREAEYFDRRELEAQTGQPRDNFFHVLLKELCDNGLDAAETAGRTPVLGIDVDIQLHIHTGDMPLRQFIRQFKGLSSTGKAKTVADAMTATRLSELDGQPGEVRQLRNLIIARSDTPKPDVLGGIGAAHWRGLVDERFGIVADRFWYKRMKGLVGLIPYSIEVAMAEVEQDSPDDYQFPPWCYDKILFVEKKGLWPVVESVKLAERFDMAVVCGEGFSTTAIRTLLAGAATDQGCRVFILHDCDPYGYDIARTAAEATQRMPNHNIEVIDLGLKLADAKAMGLNTERYTRKAALPQELIPRLTDDELTLFTGESANRKTWIAHRVELNAMSNPELIDFIERKLVEHGADTKVVPPNKVLERDLAKTYQGDLAKRVRSRMLAVIHAEKLVENVSKKLALPEGMIDQEQVQAELEKHPASAWNSVVESRAAHVLDKQTDAINDAVVEFLRKAI